MGFTIPIMISREVCVFANILDIFCGACTFYMLNLQLLFDFVRLTLPFGRGEGWWMPGGGVRWREGWGRSGGGGGIGWGGVGEGWGGVDSRFQCLTTKSFSYCDVAMISHRI